jgi:hypothetical protein
MTGAIAKRMAAVAAALALAGCSILPDGRSHDPRPQARSGQQQGAQISARPELRQCLANLGNREASFAPLPDRYYGAGCATTSTVSLAAVRGDISRFELANLGPVSCPLADAFAAWARYGVDRAARQMLGSGLARIETMGSYSCRNVAGSGRLSAHATAQAIDVAGFVLEDGRHVSIRDDWSGGNRAEREFLRILHRSACKRLGTVLGPDYNAAHRDHFHLELTGGGYCR